MKWSEMTVLILPTIREAKQPGSKKIGMKWHVLPLLLSNMQLDSKLGTGHLHIIHLLFQFTLLILSLRSLYTLPMLWSCWSVQNHIIIPFINMGYYII